MRRDVVALLHAGYWTLYALLLAVVVAALRLPHRGDAIAGVAAAWPIAVLAIAPNAAAFYGAYWLVFPRLARRGLPAAVIGTSLVCAFASLSGLLFAFILFGAHQPAFSHPREMGSLAVSFAGLAAIHATIALVLRGFIGWYDDLGVKAELTRRTQEMELALIRARLDPHFLFNSLNNIDVLISRNPAAASDYLNKLSDILRFVLYDTRQPVIPLAEELGYIDKYIALERIRSRRPRYTAHEVVGDPSGLTIAPMTFIPFIENAFKHSDAAKEDGAIVSRIAIEGREVRFECSNRASVDAAPADRGGLGHELIRQRLQLLYPQRHALETANLSGVYRVRLTIQAS